jgi:NADH:ubiquinone reductase (H+-translocating)
MTKRMLVAGGGIAGFGLIKHLLKHTTAEALHITLADPQADFVFKPILYEQLNGRIVSINRAAYFEAHQQQLQHKACKVIQCLPTANGPTTIVFDDGSQASFDLVVLALGAKTNYFGVEGAPENCLPLLTQTDMNRFKQSLDTKLTRAANTNAPLSFDIIGAGLSGVELAFELRAYLENDAVKRYGQLPPAQIRMIEAMPTILPGFSADEIGMVLGRLKAQGITVLTGHQVKQVTSSTITVAQGDAITQLETEDPLWVAGVKANLPADFFGEVTVDRYPGSDRIKLTPYLQVPNHPNLYVIGDLAGVENPKTKRLFPTTGQLSDQQSAYVGKRIQRELRKGGLTERYPAFEAQSKGHFVSLGPGKAAMTFDEAPGLLAGKTLVNPLIANVRWVYYGTKMKL